MIARYEQLTGHTVRDKAWHEVFGGQRFAVLMARAGTMLIEAGVLPPGHTMATNNPATQLLATMIDVPAPVGETTSFLTESSSR